MSWRHGPHQAAQKSTTTGSSRERSTTSAWKVCVGRVEDHACEDSGAARPLGMAEIAVEAGGVTLAGEESGEGTPGRPAARADRDAPLRRDGLARARARRAPRRRLRRARPRRQRRPRRARTPTATTRWPGDLLAVLDDRGIDRALLAGASMGAHTLVRFALDHGDRVAGHRRRHAGLRPRRHAGRGARGSPAGTRSPTGLREGGVEGFVEAYGTPKSPERWHDTIFKVLRQRLAAHEHPEALADALRAVPRSRPFEDWSRARGARRSRPSSSRAATRPTPSTRTRSASATPRRSRARSCAPRSRDSPLAWQGSQLSAVIAELGGGLRARRGGSASSGDQGAYAAQRPRSARHRRRDPIGPSDASRSARGRSPAGTYPAQLTYAADGARRHPRHQHDRALDHRLVVVGGGEAPRAVAPGGGRRSTRRSRGRARPRSSSRAAGRRRAGGPPRRPSPRVGRAAAEHADEADLAREPDVALELLGRAAGRRRAWRRAAGRCSRAAPPGRTAARRRARRARPGPRTGRRQFVTRW